MSSILTGRTAPQSTDVQVFRLPASPRLASLAFDRNTIQRSFVFTAGALGDAKLGGLAKRLGELGRRPALLCVAVKRKLNGIAFNRAAKRSVQCVQLLGVPGDCSSGSATLGGANAGWRWNLGPSFLRPIVSAWMLNAAF